MYEAVAAEYSRTLTLPIFLMPAIASSVVEDIHVSDGLPFGHLMLLSSIRIRHFAAQPPDALV